MKLVIRYTGVPGVNVGDLLDLGTATGSGTGVFLIAVISATLIIVYEIIN